MAPPPEIIDMTDDDDLKTYVDLTQDEPTQRSSSRSTFAGHSAPRPRVNHGPATVPRRGEQERVSGSRSSQFSGALNISDLATRVLQGGSPKRMTKVTRTADNVPLESTPPRPPSIKGTELHDNDMTLERPRSGRRSIVRQSSAAPLAQSVSPLRGIASESITFNGTAAEAGKTHVALRNKRENTSKSVAACEDEPDIGHESRSRSSRVSTSSATRIPIANGLGHSDKKVVSRTPNIQSSASQLLPDQDNGSREAHHPRGEHHSQTVSALRGSPSYQSQSISNEADQEAASRQLLENVHESPAHPVPSQSAYITQNASLSDKPQGVDRTVTSLRLYLGKKSSMRDNPRSVDGPIARSTNREGMEPGLIDEDDSAISERGIIELAGETALILQDPEPFDSQTLKRSLQMHEKNMWSAQEYLMKSALRQAKVDCINAIGPKLDNSLPDPFDAFTGESFFTTEKAQADAKSQSRARLHSRIFNSAYTTHIDGYIHFNSIEYESNLGALPRYKSIVRLGPNILAKNDRALKYMPYFTSQEGPQSRQENELKDELQKRYINRVETLPEQRKCSELAEFWRECVEDFLKWIGIDFYDVMYALLSRTKNTWRPEIQLSLEEASSWPLPEEKCSSCKTRIGLKEWWKLVHAWDSREIHRPERSNLALAVMTCHVFRDVAKFSIWHIASTALDVQQLYQKLKQNEVGSRKPTTLCLICRLHNCPTHGAYLENASDASSASDSSEDSENDGELGHNVRQRVTLSTKHEDVHDDHICGVYCVAADVSSQDILGLQLDGEVRGISNTLMQEGVADGSESFDDQQLCSDNCFWSVQKRTQAVESQSTLSSSAEMMSLYQLIMPRFLRSRRGPCMIALALQQVSCMDVFKQIRTDMKLAEQHQASSPGLEQISEIRRTNNVFDHYSETSNTHALDDRVPFVPCSHSGTCDKNVDCSCYKNRTSCERVCGCSKDCGRRYTGCKCVARGRKVCFQSNDCDCWRLNRECDPFLCGSCGVVEVLDPLNRYDEDVQELRCKNAKLQRDVPRRTLKGRSDVQGWGLFAGEDIKKHEYIGEYKGEIVGESESDRRGAVYHHRGLEYLFKLNKNQEIDSSRAGNKMRFINNSGRNDVINVEAKKMFCNGIQRIMLYSRKPIEAGRELFFNYGYPKSVTKNFWEPGEGPGQASEIEHESSEVEAAVQDKGKAVESSVYAVKQPRKKGVGHRIHSKHQARANGRWAKVSRDETEFRKDITGTSLVGVDDGNIRPEGTRKRKRVEVDSLHDIDELAIPLDRPRAAHRRGASDGVTVANTTSDDAIPATSSIYNVPEIAESEDDDYEEDVASEETSTSEDSVDEEDLEEEEDDNNKSGAEAARMRRISAGDTRYGGRAQRAAWATRRLKEAQAVAEEAAKQGARKTRGQMTARGSYSGTGGRPRKRGK